MTKQTFLFALMATMAGCDSYVSVSGGAGSSNSADKTSDCVDLGPTSIRWKPVSESDGNLVVLHNLDGTTQLNTDPIEIGNDRGASNGYAHTVRFSKPGASYQSGCILQIGDAKYSVADSGSDYR